MLEEDDLLVSDGQLLRRGPQGDTSIDDVDYLVVSFEYRRTLVDETLSLVEALPFHVNWRAASVAIARGKGDPGAAESEMTELRSAVLLSPDLTEADRLPLLQLYDVKREQWESQFRPKSKGPGESGLLGALGRRVAAEKMLGSDIARLLSAAGAVVAEIGSAPREVPPEAEPDSTEMAQTFATIVEGQRQQIVNATPEELAAAARAYAAAASKG
jgi:hypothetical protein